MRDRGIFSRFVIPVLFVVGTMVVSGLVFDWATSMHPGFLRTLIKDVFGALTLASIWFFAFAGPPLAYFRGAKFFERFVVAFINPVIWLIRMSGTVACQFNTVEMVYFLFLPWTFGLVCVTLFEFSISEIMCRLLHRSRGLYREKVRVLPPVVLIMLIAGIIGVYLGLIRGQEWSYMVVHHYASHFVR